MLCEQDVALVDAVRATLAAARRDGVHTDDGVHSAAAAARDSVGTIFTGMSIEHPAGGACAELVVAGAAAASGCPPLSTVIVMRQESFAEPCLRCCRVLHDLYPELRIIVPVLVRVGTPLSPGVGFQATPISRVLLNQERRAAEHPAPQHGEGDPDR